MYIGKCGYYDIITEIILKLVSFQVHSAWIDSRDPFPSYFDITDYDDIFLLLKDIVLECVMIIVYVYRKL